MVVKNEDLWFPFLDSRLWLGPWNLHFLIEPQMILIEAEHTLRTTAAIEVTKMNKVWYIFLRNSQDRAKKTSVLRSHTSKQYEILVNNSTHNLLQSRH